MDAPMMPQAVYQKLPPNPDILIEGEPYRSTTFPVDSVPSISDISLPIIDDNDETPLAELLRKHAEKSVESYNSDFWSLKLLRHIVSRKRVLAELNTLSDLQDPETYLGYILPEEGHILISKTQTYLKTFTLLVLFERVDEIHKFIEEEVSDQSLPVRRHQATTPGRVNICHKDRPDRLLECFRQWKTHEREDFLARQWRLLVPYFELDDDKRARHYDLEDESILPWCKREDRSQSSSRPSGWNGGYAFVSRVKIDPHSHGFHGILKAIGLKNELFAIKVLHKLDEAEDGKVSAQFRNELAQLKRFNGLVHEHLVTLLATYTVRDNYYFVFPCADGTLEDYWEITERTPKMDIVTARWVSKQCAGIMTAIDAIHEPKSQQNLAVKRYGRHGDIKPDNILWFHSVKDPKGILIISDMGLTSFNRDTSRSNIPGSRLPGAPGYRPPECEIKGGTVNRSFDIWTLGCLFLELLTWLLGGYRLIEEFSRHRSSVFILTGVQNNIFFTLKEIHGGPGYVAQVKPQVTEWFDRLHNHEKCSQFIHDALDVIERQMLIVLSDGRKRSLSGKLKAEFNSIHSSCADDNDRNYCLRGVPRPLPRLFRAATVVEADLNDVAKMTLSERLSAPELPTHDPTQDGRVRKAMRPEDMEQMDT